MQIHDLKRKNPNQKARTIGRGGKRGKTSGRGHKGQKARAGHRIRPEIRDLIKKLPKRRGYSAPQVAIKPRGVNLGTLERIFESGAEITPAVLLGRGLVRRERGAVPRVKILATGEIKKPLVIRGCLFSASAKTKIEKVGGRIS